MLAAGGARPDLVAHDRGEDALVTGDRADADPVDGEHARLRARQAVAGDGAQRRQPAEEAPLGHVLAEGHELALT